MLLGRIVVLCLLLGFSNVSWADVAEKTGSETDVNEQHSETLTFKKDPEIPGGFALKIIGFLMLVGVVGYVVSQRYKISSTELIGDSKIKILDRKVITPKMVGVVVEVSGRELLIVQDKQSHSVTELRSVKQNED